MPRTAARLVAGGQVLAEVKLESASVARLRLGEDRQFEEVRLVDQQQVEQDDGQKRVAGHVEGQVLFA